MSDRPVDVAFTPSVRATQTRKGSRKIYDRMVMEEVIDKDLSAFVANIRSFYLGTVSADGQPYIQHRGGTPGFLRVLDDHTLAFVDFTGNRQFISTGNLSDNAKAFIFLMDYTRRMRIKIWGSARVIDRDLDLVSALMPEDYRARPEQVIIFTITAWDSNCPQHIPQMLYADDVARVLAERDDRIRALEREVAELRGR